METGNMTDHYGDNRNFDQSRQSQRSVKKTSRASSTQKQRHKKIPRDEIKDEDEKEGGVDSRSRTRIWRVDDPDRDHVSDGSERRRSSGSFYSEDYENDSLSGRSLSPYSRSRTPSPTRQRVDRVKRPSNSPLYKTGGVGRRGVSRPQRPAGQPQQYRRGGRSQSKESTPPKDLDLVTKRMLSARLLKINELRNALAELQLRFVELQKENRVLRQLQVRQEKALQRYDDTESEISQLLSRHANETHVLRERLRRTQERERAAERRLKDSEEQLQRSHLTIARMKKLVEQRELGARDDLNRRLDEEKTRALEAERKIKELERLVELSNSSYKRQLVAEGKKTAGVQEEVRALQDELERLTTKLKEKERELDAMNIYANRIAKTPLRKDTDSATKRKQVHSRNSTKAVQTDERAPSLDFPTPPPAITDAHEFSEQASDEYLSLKEIDRVERHSETEERRQNREQQQQQKIREKGRDGEKDFAKEKELENKEKQQLIQELNVLEEKAKRLRDGWEKEKEEEDRKRTSSLLNQREDESRQRGHVQEEVERWNQGALANQHAAEEARRKKEQLLAKMREIDNQNQRVQSPVFPSSIEHPSQSNQNASIFNLTEPEESPGLLGRESVGRRRAEGGGGGGRRTLRAQTSNDDLAFGSYAPSFGHSSHRCSAGFPPPPPPKEDRDSALEAIGIFSLRGAEADRDKEAERAAAGRDRKSSLMQQLFGTLAPTGGSGAGSLDEAEVRGSPPAPAPGGARSRREGLLGVGTAGSPSPPASSSNTLHITDSRPAIRAIASFDDDIEELTL